MTVLSTISNLAIPPWLRIALKLAPYVVILGLSLGLLATRATLREVRSADTLAAAQSALHVAETELRWGSVLIARQSEYSTSLAALQKVKEGSYADTASYAKTPAGTSECLTADRMSSIAAYARDAEAAVSSTGSGSTVQGASDPIEGSQ